MARTIDQSLCEPFIGCLGASSQKQKLPRGNEKDRIGSFCWQCGGIKTNDRELAQLVVESIRKPNKLSQIQGAKIKKEIPVNEFIVHVEKVNLLLGIFLPVFWRFPSRSGCQNIMTRWRSLQCCIIEPLLSRQRREGTSGAKKTSKLWTHADTVLEKRGSIRNNKASETMNVPGGFLPLPLMDSLTLLSPQCAELMIRTLYFDSLLNWKGINRKCSFFLKGIAHYKQKQNETDFLRGTRSETKIRGASDSIKECQKFHSDESSELLFPMKDNSFYF